MLGISTTNVRVGGFRGGILADSKTIYNRIIADGGVSNLTRLNFFVKGLKAIYGDLANVPVCYDAHWIGYKLGSGTGATAGQAAAKLYSLTVAGDAVQATAASQPLLLSHNGVDNYWWGSGVSGNYVSTPITVLSSTTTNFEIKAQINLQNYSSNAYTIVGQYITGNNNFLFFIRNGILELYFVAAGVGYNYNSTVAVGFTNNTDGYIKVTRDSATGAVKYYKSTDGTTYTQLGATVIGVTGAITPPTTSDLEVGMYGISLSPFLGKIYRLTIANSIGGTPVVDFNPATYNASTSQTAWTSATGEVWTINTGTATTGYKGVLVDRTIVQLDKVDDVLLSTNSFSFNSDASVFIVSRQFINTAFNVIASYGTGPSDYAAWYNESGNQNYVDYKGATQKFKGFTGQGILLALNSYHTLSNVFTQYKNNVSQGSSTNATVPNITSSPINLGKLAGAGSYGNINLSTFIALPSNSDATQITAMYNLIRSLNNNAF